jgi:hypothetical protein
MNKAKLKIAVLKEFISRNEVGAERLKRLYKKQTLNDKLNQNHYSYEV